MMADYEQPKTDWQGGDIPGDDDFNRIEENTKANREDLANIVEGRYTGDGNDHRVINLGFTPAKVTIQPVSSVEDDDELRKYRQWDMIGFEEDSVVHQSLDEIFEDHTAHRFIGAVHITNGGFRVGRGFPTANKEGVEYIYFAIG